MRYILLIIINLPIIFLALLNLVTQYKLKKIDKDRFRHQLFLWIVILILIALTFPIYNLFKGYDLLNSSTLSLFDIAEITAIVYLIFHINSIRTQLDKDELRLRELHEELSIRLSESDKK